MAAVKNFFFSLFTPYLLYKNVLAQKPRLAGVIFTAVFIIICSTGLYLLRVPDNYYSNMDMLAFCIGHVAGMAASIILGPYLLLVILHYNHISSTFYNAFAIMVYSSTPLIFQYAFDALIDESTLRSYNVFAHKFWCFLLLVTGLRICYNMPLRKAIFIVIFMGISSFLVSATWFGISI